MKRRIRKILVVALSTILLNTSILNSYCMTVEAAGVGAPLYYQLLQGYFTLIGYEFGFGTSVQDSATGLDTDVVADWVGSWHIGHNVSLGNQNLPDLRDATNFLNVIQQMINVTVNYGINQAHNEKLDKLNKKSFAASGTFATKTIAVVLQTIYNHYSEAGLDKLQEDLNVYFSSFSNKNDEAIVSDTYSMGLISKVIATIVLLYANAPSSWLNPVNTTAYPPSSLDYFEYTYGGVKYPVYYTDVFRCEASSTSAAYETKFAINKKVYVLLGKSDTKKLDIKGFSDGAFTVTQSNVYKGTDNIYSGSPLVHNSYTNTYGHIFILAAAGRIPTLNYYNGAIPEAAVTALNSYLKSCSYAPQYLDKASAIDSAVDAGFDAMYGKLVTPSDVINIADTVSSTVGSKVGTTSYTETLVNTIAETTTTLPEKPVVDVTDGEYGSILDKILAAIMALAAAIWTLFSEPIEAIKMLMREIGETILTIPRAIWLLFQEAFDKLLERVDVIVDRLSPWREEGDSSDFSSDSLDFFEGFILLIMIIFELLQIFLHCLQFIINIFKIPAGTAFLPEGMITGLDYIKSLIIPGIGMSVYDFMFGLVYIYIIFYVIRILRLNINHIRIPR